ncbi:MAG: cation:proton antiporter, partial [Patescibacteria group bacterium]
MVTGLFELAVVILIAAALGILAKIFKQPIILAYLATGVLIAYLGFLNFESKETFQVFADLGIMFLLFLVGLEINYTSLRLVGKASIIVGLGQVIFATLFGFIIAYLLNFSLLHSLYISVALTFSSTIIIVKLLSDKKDLNSLYGKISIGLLLVQDLIAILLLVFLSGIESSQGIVWSDLVLSVLKGITLFVAMIWLGRKILPLIFDKIARSQELLFLISLMWVFTVAALVSKIGFSIEIAGLLAGLALANSSEHFQIANKIRPLRDFFILIFFVVLGSSIIFSDLSGITWPIIIFSLFVLVGNPIIVFILMGFMGYRKRTSFFAGVTTAQISEFSLILAALGLKLGHISESVVALITAVGVVTITLSSYLIIHNEKIFHHLSPLLSVFEKQYIYPINIRVN